MTERSELTWRCRHCGADLGAVRDGRLYLADVEVLEGVIVCRVCRHTRQWHGRDKRQQPPPSRASVIR